MLRSAWRRAREASCSSTEGTCRSSGAIATPPTSSITRATSRCSTTSTSILFEAAGFSKQDIVKKYGLVGIPMVDTQAKFYISSTHGDWITIESRVESFKRSSFEVTHKVFKGERWRSRRSRRACWSGATRTIPPD